jgi:hypothetical protein
MTARERHSAARAAEETTMAQTTTRIDTTTEGYAIRVRCGKGHSGNQGYVLHSRGYWQCQGCGDFVGSADLADRQRAARLRSADPCVIEPPPVQS